MALRQAVLTVFLTCILALAGCDKDKPIDIEATLLTSDIRQVLKDSDPVYASVDVSVAAGERCDEVGPALANLLRSRVYTSATYIACRNTDGDEFAVIRVSVPVLWMRSSTSITNKPVAIGINTFPDEDLLRVTYVTNRAAVLALLTELPESLQLDKYEEPAFHFSALLTNDESDSVDMHVSNVFVDDTPVVTTHRITLKRRESVRIDLSNVGNAVLATEGGQVRIISWNLDLSDLPILTHSPTLIPTATFSPASETQERTYVIGNTGGDGVYIRRTTDMADRIKAWPDGTEMVVVGPDVAVEGRLWRNVRDPDGNLGFVPAEYLVTSPPSAAAQKDPTATPEATATVPTATTTAVAIPNLDCPSPAEITYMLVLDKEFEFIGESMGELAALGNRANEDPTLYADDYWLLNFTVHLVSLQVRATNILELVPPDSARNLHRRAEDVARNIIVGVDLFESGDFQESASRFGMFADNVDDLVEALERFCDR